MHIRPVGSPAARLSFQGGTKPKAPEQSVEDLTDLELERRVFDELLEKLTAEREDSFEVGAKTRSEPLPQQLVPSIRSADRQEVKERKKINQGLDNYFAKLEKGYQPSRLRNSFTAEDLEAEKKTTLSKSKH